jgi:hypothetical protein
MARTKNTRKSAEIPRIHWVLQKIHSKIEIISYLFDSIQSYYELRVALRRVE